MRGKTYLLSTAYFKSEQYTAEVEVKNLSSSEDATTIGMKCQVRIKKIDGTHYDGLIVALGSK